jgi:hypothetical protein
VRKPPVRNYLLFVSRRFCFRGRRRRAFSLNLFRGRQTHHCWGFEGPAAIRNAAERSYSVRVALRCKCTARALLESAHNPQSLRGGTGMAITQFTRFKSDKTEEMIKNAKNAKTIFEKHGAEFLRCPVSTPARGLESG